MIVSIVSTSSSSRTKPVWNQDFALYCFSRNRSTIFLSYALLCFIWSFDHETDWTKICCVIAAQATPVTYLGKNKRPLTLVVSPVNMHRHLLTRELSLDCDQPFANIIPPIFSKAQNVINGYLFRFFSRANWGEAKSVKICIFLVLANFSPIRLWVRWGEVRWDGRRCKKVMGLLWDCWTEEEEGGGGGRV